MAENSSERAERRVWTAGIVDGETATVRVSGPGQDAAATALAAELLQIAERALQDRAKADEIVTAILRNQSQLVTTATRAVTPGQREAAQAALARAVRRAVLDALPPVIQIPVAERGAREAAATDTARPRKLRPVQGRSTPSKAAPDKAPPGTGRQIKRAPDQRTPDQRTPDRDSAEPAVARIGGGKRRRGLTLVAGLLTALVAGFALWHFVLQPTADRTAASPATAVRPSPASSTSRAEAEVLQLEAVEPFGGSLPPPSQAAIAPPADAPSTTSATVLEPLPGSPIDEGTAAALDPTQTPGGIALPAGAEALRIFILYPEGDSAAAEADALYDAMSGTSQLPLVVLRDVSFTIGSPRIRYFHAADAAAARALADFLEAPVGEWALQDFSYIRPLPSPGTVEIYVPSL